MLEPNFSSDILKNVFACLLLNPTGVCEVERVVIPILQMRNSRAEIIKLTLHGKWKESRLEPSSVVFKTSRDLLFSKY